MTKLNISGYDKFIGLRLGDWKCGFATESDTIYTFLFDFNHHNDSTSDEDFFILITIDRYYSECNGFSLTVDFSIVKSNGDIDEFRNIHTKWIYAHNLITLKKTEELFKPLLKLHA